MPGLIARPLRARQTVGMRISLKYLAAASALAIAATLGAQGTPPPTPAPADVVGPQVGTMAPDFVLAGATRTGPSQAPIRLSDLRGQTVVIAFFPKARTGG